MAAGVGRYVGIDVGGTKIEGVVLGEDLAEIARRRVPTEREKGYERVVGRIADLVAELRASAPDCRRVGIGTPGSLSARDRTLKNSNTTCLNGRPLHADLERRIGLEVVMENDANCFALAEVRAGAARGARLAFGVILGTGVGGGIVVDGRVWTGPQHVAGEWGHHRIADDGPDCYCGQRGCVETFLSGPALERSYRHAGGDGCGAAEVARRAESGEARAAGVLHRYVDRFGRALANVINILDPDVVVLGGGLSNLACLYGAGIEAVRGYVFNDELRTRIVRHGLGDAAGGLGAALLTVP
ncbi:MAG TPA: ROK family protein [Candidatus Eisenbacteria bacterium]|nr:ROK family protein [Candidatus Eisenbacteria bacterium]